MSGKYVYLEVIIFNEETWKDKQGTLSPMESLGLVFIDVGIHGCEYGARS